MNLMRFGIFGASRVAAAIACGASAATAQQPQQQATAKDSVRRLEAVSIIAAPSGRGETRAPQAGRAHPARGHADRSPYLFTRR